MSGLRNISLEQHTSIGGEVTIRSYRLRYPELQEGNRCPLIEEQPGGFEESHKNLRIIGT